MTEDGPSLRQMLSGGDRRAVKGVADVVHQARKTPALVAELAALTADPDPLVVMRAFDALEKLARDNPALVAPCKHVFLRPAAGDERWEVLLQIVRALPLFDWAGEERRGALGLLREAMEHRQIFVRAWAVDGFARFAEADPALLPSLAIALDVIERTGRKALIARAAKIRARLRRAGLALD